MVQCRCTDGVRQAKATALQRGSARKGWPSFFSPRQGARCCARTGLTGRPPAKGWGAPCCMRSSPHPTACGPTPSHPRGWAPRLPAAAGLKGPCLLASVARGSAQAPPSFQTAAFGGGWARASRSTHQAPPPGRSRLRRCPCGAAWPRGLAARRSPRRCSVATGPRMKVGRLLPSAPCGNPRHVAPVLAAAGVAHPRPSLGSTRPAEPGRGLRRGAARHCPRSSPHLVRLALRRAHLQRRARPVVWRKRQANWPLGRLRAADSGALPLHPLPPGGHGPPAPHTKGGRVTPAPFYRCRPNSRSSLGSSLSDSA